MAASKADHPQRTQHGLGLTASALGFLSESQDSAAHELSPVANQEDPAWRCAREQAVRLRSGLLVPIRINTRPRRFSPVSTQFETRNPLLTHIFFRETARKPDTDHM